MADAPRDRYGDALFVAQAATMVAGLWPGRRRRPVPGPVSAAGVGLIVAGSAVGLAALGRLGRRFRPVPAPAPDAELQAGGAYALVRHPMYLGLLMGGAGIAALRGRPEPVAALAALGLVVGAKITHEERLLRERFGPSYEAYRAAVPCLLPWPRPTGR